MENHNQLYDQIDDAAWNKGYCCIFAYALQERYGLSMNAVIERRIRDGDEWLIHCFAAAGELAIDADGIRARDQMLAEWATARCYDPGEEVEVVVREVSLDELWDLNPEDIGATQAAHRFLDARPHLDRQIARLASAVKQGGGTWSRSPQQAS